MRFRRLLPWLVLLVCEQLTAAIPAAPVLTLYRANGPLNTPYYDVDRFMRTGTPARSGTLAQGTSVVPCLIVRDGKPVTNKRGRPYIGFEIVVDPKTATRRSTLKFKRAHAQRKSLKVNHHHCGQGVRYVADIRHFYDLDNAPFFDPPRRGSVPPAKGITPVDQIVREFHASPHCDQANRKLLGRREALAKAWERFINERRGRQDPTVLEQAKHLDYGMRTALFEGQLDGGCTAYAGCARSIVALTLRNRAHEMCRQREGCRFPGDVQGVASNPSIHPTWDRYPTQVSGVTSCYLRADLAEHPYYHRLQAAYGQIVTDAETILFGERDDLAQVFPSNPLNDLLNTRHYYHAPSQDKCFPGTENLAFIRGAVARYGNSLALITDMRVQIGQRNADGFLFQELEIEARADGDRTRLNDGYRGFALDPRYVRPQPLEGCLPYGVPPLCERDTVTRHRILPEWVSKGRPLGIQCHTQDLGQSCASPAGSKRVDVEVGGDCDTRMRPIAEVP